MHKPITKIQEGEQSKEVGTLTWSDVWGPTPIETLGGRRYYVTFTDDHSQLTYVPVYTSPEKRNLCGLPAVQGMARLPTHSKSPHAPLGLRR